MDELQAKYDAMCKKYLFSLSDKFDQVNSLKEKFTKKTWNENDYYELRKLVHNIAGASAMFGFSLISNSALKLDQYLKSIENLPDGSNVDKILISINELSRIYADTVSVN
ncbi:MAG: Hpt domain-containing protein [Candidatus Gastranaerophilales bacterium]|nr:Hpt domain-containing protein [Candidatus Gastranaerophilales bacterium]